MSFRGLLKHRITVKRLTETFTDGVPTSNWEVVSVGVRSFVDLTFIRKGKDPLWTPEAGRPADRSGVLFTEPSADVRSGDRVFVTFGPTGTFQIEGAVDDAWTPTKLHHRECGIVEVASQIAGRTA